MAVRQVQFCDLCNSTEDVDTMTVVWHYLEGNPWSIDLCERCYQSRMGDIAEKGGRAKINNIRPQARVRKKALDAKVFE